MDREQVIKALQTKAEIIEANRKLMEENPELAFYSCEGLREIGLNDNKASKVGELLGANIMLDREWGKNIDSENMMVYFYFEHKGIQYKVFSLIRR